MPVSGQVHDTLRVELNLCFVVSFFFLLGDRSISIPLLYLLLCCRRKSVVIDFGGRLKSLESMALAYSDLSTQGDAGEAAEGLFGALRWAEGQPTAQRLLIAGRERLYALIQDKLSHS